MSKAVATAPTATGRTDVRAPAERVYDLISDPAVLAELAEEYEGYAWLGGATSAQVGARFRGRNGQGGSRRWSTVSTITDADRSSRFAFDVQALGFVPVARWQYDIEPSEDGCIVVESTWDRRPGWFELATQIATGVSDRTALNHRNIEATLRRLKDRAESGA